MSISQHTIKTNQSRRKFVYRDVNNTAGENQPFENEDISEDSCSESDSDENDLEADLLAFDKEQADMIRHINKMGSMKSAQLSEHHQPMQFLASSLSPTQQRRTQVTDKVLSQSGHEIGFYKSKDRAPKSPQPPVRTSADAALKKHVTNSASDNNLSSDHSLNN